MAGTSACSSLCPRLSHRAAHHHSIRKHSMNIDIVAKNQMIFSWIFLSPPFSNVNIFGFEVPICLLFQGLKKCQWLGDSIKSQWKKFPDFKKVYHMKRIVKVLVKKHPCNIMWGFFAGLLLFFLPRKGLVFGIYRTRQLKSLNIYSIHSLQSLNFSCNLKSLNTVCRWFYLHSLCCNGYCHCCY